MTQREARKCDSCGFMERHYRTVQYVQDGRTVYDLVMCRRCASAALDGFTQHVVPSRRG